MIPADAGPVAGVAAADESRPTGRDATLQPQKARGLTAKPWWPWLKRGLTLAFFALVGYLIVSQARNIEWSQVFSSMRQQPAQGLWIAAVLTACSHALISTFDLFGRRATGHGLKTQQVCTVNFISYAFNLNLGSLIGGVAFRYRLYSRLGLDNAVITEVIATSMLTNWLGYLLVGGIAFASGTIDPPDTWKVGATGLRVLGAALVAVAVAYLLLCAFARRREWSLRGHQLKLPSLRFAALQLTLASINWLVMGGIVFVLLQQRVAYPVVLAVLLVAAIAGVITHVPAGLGVLEAVFVALLSHAVPQNELLGALLAYRAMYYLAPLALATLVYVVVETRAKRRAPVGRDAVPSG